MTSCDLFVDIETYSSVDLAKSGVYPYAESPDFEILLIGYALGEGEVTVLDVKNGDSLHDFLSLLVDPTVRKIAHNASFERVCLSRLFEDGGYLRPEQWYCTATMAAYNGLPRALADVGDALHLAEDQAKMREGKQLVQYFCKPCKPTRTNGGRTRNLPEHAPEKWATFIAYNKQDVVSERAIYHRLTDLPNTEWRAYWLDQHINDRGVRIEQTLMRNAITINEHYTAKLMQEAQELTGLENPNSLIQIKEWLGSDAPLDKKAVQSKLQDEDLSASQRRLLEIRQETGKSSVAKYRAMEAGLCKDGRVRGLFAFYGANRTGRWAGRLLQLQNLPQNHIPTLDWARELVLEGDEEMLETYYPSTPRVLSELIRTAIIPSDGSQFCVADFSAIEARVVAWLADEKWRMDFFGQGGDIYCASATKMFGVPVVKHGVNGHLRQKGKIAELACGYGGSTGAMISMGALEMGIPEQELQTIVENWRTSNPHIVQLWYDYERAAMEAITDGKSTRMKHGITFTCRSGALQIFLPSGRHLNYVSPRIGENRFGRPAITYLGVNTGKWMRLETFGGKLVENVVQAVARDCLLDAMTRVSIIGLPIVMHVHDEMIVETRNGEQDLQRMLEIMKCPPIWAKGLILEGDGYVCNYYRKD